MANRGSEAAPAAQTDLILAVTRLIDLVNDQAKDGVAHSGVLKEAVALTTSNTEVFHGLGRAPRFVLGVMMNANAVIFSDTPHGDPRNFINLKASAAVTANVLLS